MQPGGGSTRCRGMNTPQKPPEPPTDAPPADHNPTGTTPHGIPEDMDDTEAKGLPTSDRHQTETTPGT